MGCRILAVFQLYVDIENCQKCFSGYLQHQEIVVENKNGRISFCREAVVHALPRQGLATFIKRTLAPLLITPPCHVN
ncbi:hypothetical protein T11_9522 [Trichinella zimbabwensis]|uniref:Uncharacterized protein n=1 Tax=Trichinella zimbabwensis TaxID=268475 RepID=A0A0V1GID2_9BILA|nr:hypothetical protein T11_9522 [Trichinella zimbabwensis]